MRSLARESNDMIDQPKKFLTETTFEFGSDTKTPAGTFSSCSPNQVKLIFKSDLVFMSGLDLPMGSPTSLGDKGSLLP